MLCRTTGNNNAQSNQSGALKLPSSYILLRFSQESHLLVGRPVVLRMDTKLLETRVVIGIQVEGEIKEHVRHCRTGAKHLGLQRQRQPQKLVASNVKIPASKCKVI